MKRTIMALVAVAGILGLVGCASEEPEADTSQADMTAKCQDVVANDLKSPSSAKFGDTYFHALPETDYYTHQISGWVDAQNGFGAMIRADYRCKTLIEEDGTVVADVMDFNSRG